MPKKSDTTESSKQAITRLRRLETIESLLDFDLISQIQYADEIAEERQRLTCRTLDRKQKDDS